MFLTLSLSRHLSLKMNKNVCFLKKEHYNCYNYAQVLKEYIDIMREKDFLKGPNGTSGN